MQQSSFSYFTKRCNELDIRTLKLCSDLFSCHYGVYDGKDGKHQKGQRIRLGIRYYQNLQENPDMFVSLCFKDNDLVGQAFFLRKNIGEEKKCSWVIQLLVHSAYRGRGVAKRLLHSAWGFSDYFAWGLATANAVTIKTLESVTWRKVDPMVIAQNQDVISSLCDNIAFARSKIFHVGEKHSQIFTDFYPEREQIPAEISDVYVNRLGDLQDGCEWLAFTFQTQEMIVEQTHFSELLDFSASQLEDAYSRMDMSAQNWTKYTASEIDYVVDKAQLRPGQRILDMGCGMGRHTIELAKRGFEVMAVDNSYRLMTQAVQNAYDNLPISCFDRTTFLTEDCRKASMIPGSFDAVICLYDVIGSYRTKEENCALIDAIGRKLKKGGIAVISVMNMDLTEAIATQRASLKTNFSSLLKLKSSDIMQSSGNVFNPEYFILDSGDHLVYRKEQFSGDGYLNTEYVIADYRFTMSEICQECELRGLHVLHSSFVQLGAWQLPLTATDPKAKEILLVVQK